MCKIWVETVCLYLYQYQRKYRESLWLGPPFSNGFRFVDQLIAFCLIFAPVYFLVDFVNNTNTYYKLKILAIEVARYRLSSWSRSPWSCQSGTTGMYLFQYI